MTVVRLLRWGGQRFLRWLRQLVPMLKSFPVGEVAAERKRTVLARAAPEQEGGLVVMGDPFSPARSRPFRLPLVRAVSEDWRPARVRGGWEDQLPSARSLLLLALAVGQKG